MNYHINTDNGVSFITFELFEKLGVTHAFSTKKGGISEGIYESLNLRFSIGDNDNHVMENQKRFAKVVGYSVEKLVLSDQMHKTEIKTVTNEDCGKGILKESDIIGIDGLVTKEKDVVIMTYYADCVPLYFFDPINEVVGMAHSGWRGTVDKIGAVMVEKMVNEFSCDRENIYSVIGPSICQDCYEVSKDVADEFCRTFEKKYWDEILKSEEHEKYKLNLWRANEIILLEAGLDKNHISVSGLCTCCNSDLLFSHRATKGRRGTLAGVITLGGKNE